MKKWSFFILFIISCNVSPEKIIVGRDVCSNCKMTVSDNRFGGTLVTEKGKVYFFDDIVCLISFMKEHGNIKKKIKAVYLTNFSDDHALIDANKAIVVKTEFNKGPMNGDLIAFANIDSSNHYLQFSKAEVVNWKTLLE